MSFYALFERPRAKSMPDNVLNSLLRLASQRT